MAITVMNSQGEQEMLTTGKIPVRPEVEADNARGKKPEAKEAGKAEAKAIDKAAEKAAEKAPEKDVDDESPEWVKRLGINAEQHKGITEIIQKAINKKHGQAKEAEEFAEQVYNERVLAERRAEQLERELNRLKAQAPAPKADPEADKPKRENFQTDEAFRDAMDDWRVDQKFKEREAKIAKEREEARQQEILEAATARVVKAREVVPDYDEVVGEVDTPVPNHIAAYMQESEMFAELGYHFAKHPEDLRRLSQMPARTYADLARVGVAIGKIESTLKPFAAAASNGDASEKATNGAKPSPANGVQPSSDTGSAPSSARAAAPVIQPLSVGSDSQVEKPVGKMTYAEAKADWEKKHGRNLRLRQRH